MYRKPKVLQHGNENCFPVKFAKADKCNACMTWSNVKFAALRCWTMASVRVSRWECSPIRLFVLYYFNSLRPRLNGSPFADDIFKCIFLNENKWILPRISLKFVPKVRINNIPALVQIMAWRRPGDKALSEPMMVSLLTHICVTGPQWVNRLSFVSLPVHNVQSSVRR